MEWVSSAVIEQPCRTTEDSARLARRQAAARPDRVRVRAAQAGVSGRRCRAAGLVTGVRRLARGWLNVAGDVLPGDCEEHERAVAIYDLIEENSFWPEGHDGGPYALNLRIDGNRLVFDIRLADGTPVIAHLLSLAP